MSETTTTATDATTTAPVITTTTDADAVGKTFSQAELDRIVSDRLTREKAKYADYDDLKAKAADADRLRKESETASEKAVREAGEKAVTDERAASTPRLVRAEFRAAAKGVLSDAARDALLEDLDLSKYLTDKGEVDVARVEKKVAALAPAKSGKFPDLGQQRRGEESKPSVSRGAQMFRDRHPNSPLVKRDG